MLLRVVVPRGTVDCLSAVVMRSLPLIVRVPAYRLTWQIENRLRLPQSGAEHCLAAPCDYVATTTTYATRPARPRSSKRVPCTPSASLHCQRAQQPNTHPSACATADMHAAQRTRRPFNRALQPTPSLPPAYIHQCPNTPIG